MAQHKENYFSDSFLAGGYASIFNIFEEVDASIEKKGLIIAVYLLHKDTFIYCNDAFQKLIGAKIERLYKERWDFWYSNILREESSTIRSRIENFISTPFNKKQLSLRYHCYDGNENPVYVNHEIVLHKLEHFAVAVNYFFDVSKKEQIENRIDKRTGDSSTKSSPKEVNISPREKEVLKLIADGYSTKQIAHLLFISRHTAISHRKHLLNKFKVKNTAQMIKKAAGIMEL